MKPGLLTYLPLLVVLASCGSGAGDAPRPHVLVISLDTVRAEHMGVYGYGRGTTPHLDSWASRSVVFDQAYSTASHTLAAHVSLFTGLFPESHGVVSSHHAIPEDLTTLAETLTEQGYTAGAFVNGAYLHPKHGLDQGFEIYDAINDKATTLVDGEPVMGRDGFRTNDALLSWLDSVGTESPVLLFAHYFDAHSDWRDLPYEAPPEYLERFAGTRPPGYKHGEGDVQASRYLLHRTKTREGFSPEELDYLRSLYDAGIAYLDDAVGELFQELEQRDLLDDCLVVVISDHGEEFQDHGRFLHSQVFEELVRVPLMMSFPSGPWSGRHGERIEEPVQITDVLPTIYSYLEVDSSMAPQGRSLLPLLAGEESWTATPIFCRNQRGTQYSLRQGRWKLVFSPADATSRLYDLDADPGESRDLSESQPEELRLLQEEFRTCLRRFHEGKIARPKRIEVDEKSRRALEALGYVEDSND